MTNNIIIDTIRKQLEEIQDWNPKTFDFNIPTSTFSEENDIININNLIIFPDFDESEDLAKNTNNHSIKLNSSQLKELRSTGKFSVPSKNFKGQKHVWIVDNILQSGTDNIKDSFFEGLANASVHIIISIPERIYKDKHFTIKNSLKEIKTGLSNISGYFIGNKTKKKKYPNHIIHTKLNEYVENQIVSILVKSKNPNKQILFEFENGTHMGVSTNMYKVLLEKIKEPYDNFIKQWDKNAASREKQLYEKYKNTDMEKDEIIKHVLDQENQILQEKILELINYILLPQEATILTNLFTCIYEIRNYIAKYDRDKKQAIDQYHTLLRKKYHILYRIEKWRKNKINNYEKRWLINHPIENQLLMIAENFIGQEKYIFTNHIQIKKSPDYIELQKNLNNAKIPDRIYTHEYQIWNHKKWIITKKYDNYYVQKHIIIKNSTDRIGWRIANLFKRSSRLMNNGSYALIFNMLMGPFGIRSLFGLEKFNSNYQLSDNGKLIPKNQYKTWFGKINDLWKNIFHSRIDFEDKLGDGILDKKFTYIFNTLYNYIVKGVVGTTMIALGHPLIVIFNIIIGIIGTITSPLWAFTASVIFYLLCAFIYDFDAPDIQEYHWFPFIRTIINQIFVGGIGQFVASLIAIGSHGIIGLLSFVWIFIVTTTNYCYDYCIYHTILKRKAKIPICDDFFVKRISGPGLGSKYFYLIDYQMALIMVQYSLEEMEMHAYKQEIKTKISEPRNNLIKFYDQFNNLGLQMDNNSDRIKNFTETQKQLESKLTKIENEYWSNYNIKGNFKNTNKIRIDKHNLLIVLKYAPKLCESYFINNILPRLNESFRIMFWEDKKLEENDWNGLALHCLISAFGSGIIQPFENTDNEMYYLTINEINSKKFLSKLFDGNPLENLETENLETKDFNLVTNVSNIKSDIKLITPNNVLSGFAYETILFIKDDFFGKEINQFFEYAEPDNIDYELQEIEKSNSGIFVKNQHSDQNEISDDENQISINKSNQNKSLYQEYLEMESLDDDNSSNNTTVIINV